MQVFLDKFYRHLSKDPSKEPTTEATFTLAALSEIGGISDVLRDFLEEQIVTIANALLCDQKKIWKILSPFVTVDGTKEPIGLAALNQQLPNLSSTLIEKAVLALMNNRILRYNEEENLYEIAHDSLALRIAEKRSDDEIALLEVRNLINSQNLLKDEARELFSAKQLEFINPYLHLLSLSVGEQKLLQESEAKVTRQQREAKQRKLLAAAFVGLVFVVILGFALNARKLQKDAEQNSKKNKKIVNALDFYDGKYALAFNGKYGFINQEGDVVINYDYDKGEPFDAETGFAQMEMEISDHRTLKKLGDGQRRSNVKFYVDTSGQQYRVINLPDSLGTASSENGGFGDSSLHANKVTFPLSIFASDNKNLALNCTGILRADFLGALKKIQDRPNIRERVQILRASELELPTFPTEVLAYNNLSSPSTKA